MKYFTGSSRPTGLVMLLLCRHVAVSMCPSDSVNLQWVHRLASIVPR